LPDIWEGGKEKGERGATRALLLPRRASRSDSVPNKEKREEKEERRGRRLIHSNYCNQGGKGREKEVCRLSSGLLARAGGSGGRKRRKKERGKKRREGEERSGR